MRRLAMAGSVRNPAIDGQRQSAFDQLKVGAILSAFLRQSPAVWFIQAYLFFEYVRPQTIYPVIDIAPWSQISLIGAVLLCVMEGRLAFRATAIWTALGAFTVAILASSIFAQYPDASWENINLWANWLLLMLVVGAGLRTRRELVLVLLGYFLWNLKMSQHAVKGWISIGLSFRSIGIGGAPGWFQNSGEFGIEMCVFLPLIAYFTYGLWPSLTRGRRIILVGVAGSALFSVVASSSRGALVGVAALGLWALWRTPHRGKALILIVLAGATLWFVIPPEVKLRFSQAGEDKDSVARLTYWKDGIEIAKSHPLFGIGYKNWIPYYRANYNPRGELPHNYLVECVSELGMVGLVALLSLIVSAFRATARVRRLASSGRRVRDRLLWSIALGLDGALIGYLVSGSFVSVLYYPYLWVNVSFVMALVRVASTTTTSQQEPATRFTYRTA